jgi:hypothetical protein
MVRTCKHFSGKETLMKQLKIMAQAVGLFSLVLLVGLMTSCTQETKQSESEAQAPAKAEAKTAAAPSDSMTTAKPAAEKSGADSMTTLDITPGEAGGAIEDTVSGSAKVTAVDAATRKVTLTTDDGRSETFTAGPEIRNFDQLHVGDTVTVTVTQRLVVFVRSGSGEDPAISHAAALARTPKGAKPGVLVGETYEITATVTAIDSVQRTATLKFSDGQSRTVPVRADVDLGRYKVGDTVVARVTQALSVLTSKP